jgi:hypothetical protein
LCHPASPARQPFRREEPTPSPGPANPLPDFSPRDLNLLDLKLLDLKLLDLNLLDLYLLDLNLLDLNLLDLNLPDLSRRISHAGSLTPDLSRRISHPASPIQHLTSPNPISPNLTLPNLASPNLASPNLISLQRSPPNLLLEGRRELPRAGARPEGTARSSKKPIKNPCRCLRLWQTGRIAMNRLAGRSVLFCEEPQLRRAFSELKRDGKWRLAMTGPRIPKSGPHWGCPSAVCEPC